MMTQNPKTLAQSLDHWFSTSLAKAGSVTYIQEA